MGFGDLRARRSAVNEALRSRAAGLLSGNPGGWAGAEGLGSGLGLGPWTGVETTAPVSAVGVSLRELAMTVRGQSLSLSLNSLVIRKEKGMKGKLFLG